MSDENGGLVLTAEARIQTGNPGRYLIQLCRHADSINHKILHPRAGNTHAGPDV